jgi:hypothetical protein
MRKVNELKGKKENGEERKENDEKGSRGRRDEMIEYRNFFGSSARGRWLRETLQV